MVQGINQIEEERIEPEEDVIELKDLYSKYQALLEKKGRKKVETTQQLIQDSSNSTRYNGQHQTKQMLEFIHGGETGALYGAWDFLCRYAKHAMMEELLLSYRRGKFVENLYGKFTDKYKTSDNCMKQAIATKYASHLSRRKYNFFCKIQKSTVDTSNQSWSSQSITYGDKKINLRTASLSHEAVQKFVKSLDIGEIHSIPGYCGASRTVTALVTMIIDLCLKVPNIQKSLVWFGRNTNHFVFSVLMMVHQNRKSQP